MTRWLFPESNVLPAFADSFSLVLLSVLLVILAILWFSKEQRKNFPPGPYGLPIFGYLPFLGKEPPKTLDALAKKYGNVFSISYGTTPVVVVNDFESLKEAYSKTELLNRLPEYFNSIPGGGGFSGTNGDLWTEQRRFTMKSVRNLGLGKAPWEVTIIDEVMEFVDSLQKLKGKAVDIEETILSSVSKNVIALLLAKHISESSPDCKLVTKFNDAAMKVISEDIIRYHFPRPLAWIMKLFFSSSKNEYDIVQQFDKFIWKEVKERKLATTYYDSGDFIGSYIEAIKKNTDEGNKESSFDEYNLIGNITAMIVGGSETTKTSIQWLFVAMVQYPDIQQKIYEELETVLSEKEVAQWEDRLKLPWTYASIMEAQRWRTLAPLSVMREASEDTQIGGYDIPKGTPVFAHLWAIHNDKRYWKDPEKFDPTRFIKSDGSLNFKKESYAPFSYGRRNCPGETIALMELLIYFSAVVRKFEIKAENPREKFHVEAIFGQTYQPVSHKLRFVPRTKS